MEIRVLASGSKGNMTLIKVGDESFFIDAGISISKVKKKMDDYSESIEKVETLFLTHEHSDHIIGLKGLLKLKTIKKVFLTEGTLKGLGSELTELLPEFEIIKADKEFNYNGVSIYPVMLSHDANEPVGFIFKKEFKKLVLLTDTGYVHESYYELLKDAQMYIVEANHNPSLLMNSKRPYYLKQRILNEKGHLSNLDAAILMNKVIENDKKAVWVIAHISEDCNTIQDIEEAIVSTFDTTSKVEVYFSSQESLDVIFI
ncbi:Metal-dependent hydrolase, beta-lactamase family [Alteracholeplasma palmae J233]|uniref:Metal-dependent hydrolase, beta-lactamase family n=1 Tax=Alteracholeplasma palmae (strain ATCC 49389 / J233) TaxID=1318466 RepID=U4KS80_ALTPJ|nr:MBL fold metallo-hydrolase [Alteracholeplasma palmae]CCV64801.1 Metal-dependent hydrolase, beta-lactamase family [Alteracholeplasma palmae J233]